MLERPLISIVVPIYNVENYLTRCVESIVGQSYHEIEIILVDDGSTDSSPQICDNWALKDSRIRVLHKANGGLSDARNAGMALATGELIGFIDSDDYINPEMYERLSKSIVETNSDISVCGIELFWDNEEKRMLLTKPMNRILTTEEAELALLRENELKQPVVNRLYKRHVIENELFPVGKYHEDVFWSYRAIGNAETISVIDYCGYCYYQRSNSIMGVGYSVKRLDALEAACIRYEYFLERFPVLASCALEKLRFDCMYHGQMALKFLRNTEQEEIFQFIQSLLVKYPVNRKCFMRAGFSHKVWLLLSLVSIRFTCKIRNYYKIGI